MTENDSIHLKYLNDIYTLCNVIKDGLKKKEHLIYERFLEFVHKIINNNLIHLNTELEDFRMNMDITENDSENESKNDSNNDSNNDSENDCDIDVMSVSDYETETDDEDHEKTEKLLEEYDEKCRLMLIKLKNDFDLEV